MKPTLEMKYGTPSVIPISQASPIAVETRISPRQRWLAGAIVVVVLVVVKVDTAVASVYLCNNTSMSQDNFKEAWVTYTNAKMHGSVTNKMVVTETEEDVTEPGKVRIIYDHEGRKMVVQYDTPPTRDEVCSCYVVDWNVPEGYTTDAVKSDMTDPKMTREVVFDERQNTLEPTEEKVDINSLSTRAREMCFGCNIVKALDVVKDAETDVWRRKRACYIYWYNLCYNGYCYYYWYQVCV